VGIFSENRVEWVVAEQACNAYSLVCVPVYDAGEGCLQYILNHARMNIVIASRPKTFRVGPTSLGKSLLRPENVLLLMLDCCLFFKLLSLSSSCPYLRVIIQMESIDYEESYMADQCNVRLIPFKFVEKDVRFCFSPAD